MRLLLVEDETALSEALSEILNQNGYLTDCVSNGIDGLEYIRTGIYDLILLDIMLPGMDGLSVLKKMRAEKNHTPVILLTAKSELSDIVTGLDSAADYNNVEVYISFLRQKLHALGSAVSIRTIRMAGYRLEGRS